MTTRDLSLSCVCVLGILVTGTGLDAVAGDFDGNDLADLAIGAFSEDISEAENAGAVSVIYGAAAGLDGAGNQFWTQRGLVGSDSETNDMFGLVLATGDFDGDGVFDLAVGVPREDVGSVEDAGAVHVIYGARPDGLVTTGNQYWTQDEPGMADSADAHDRFGHTLIAGDFNGDGYDDLAIGVPFEDVGSIAGAGAAHVIHGSAGGLQTGDDVLWDQQLAGSTAEELDNFGASLASGDFNSDGYDDLAIGVPYENLGDIGEAGAIDILYGSLGGLVARTYDDFWHQDRVDIPETPETGDLFGDALAVGDFDGDGHDDLAIGVPNESFGSPQIVAAGYVHVLYGSPTGIDEMDNEFFHQDSANIGSLAEAYDQFGETLAAGDFNGDGCDDLAIGVPHEDWNQVNTGIVQVVFGSSTGLTGTDELWREDLLDNFGMDEEQDRFGEALAAGDFDGDGYDDLAVGTPSEDIDADADCGVVYVLPGTAGGLSSANQWWHQGKDDLHDQAEPDDEFGHSLVAVPGSIVLFADGFESGDTNSWSSTEP